MRQASPLLTTLETNSRHLDDVRLPDHLRPDGVQPNQQRAVRLGGDPGVAAMVIAMSRIAKSEEPVFAFARRRLPELGMVGAVPAVKPVGADAIRSFSGERMTAAAEGGR